MEDLYTALSVSLAAHRRFVIHSDHSSHATQALRRICRLSQVQCVEIDLALNPSIESILQQMSANNTLVPVTVWKSLEKTTQEYQKNVLVPLLNEIDHYDTVSSELKEEHVITTGKTNTAELTSEKNSISVSTPSYFTIVAVVEVGESRPKFYQGLKWRFWLSQYYSDDSTDMTQTNTDQTEDTNESETNTITGSNQLNDTIELNEQNHAYLSLISSVDAAALSVYVSAEVRQYAYSLVVFARTHRMCSLAPTHTRLPSDAIDMIVGLAQTLVAWAHPSEGKLFVTPEFIKLLFRKVAYWLIDWEYNQVYAGDNQEDEEDEFRKSYEITLLTGDWYASNWNYIKPYLEQYRSYRDDASPVGFSNKIVEDVLLKVSPPI